MTTTLFRRLAFGAALVLWASSAPAQNYTLDLLPAGGSRYWMATDINNHGQAVGTLGDTHFPNAVTWDTRRPTQAPTYLPFHAECCTYMASWGNAINDRGQVVGEDTYRAALWNGTSRPVLLDGEFASARALGLNDAGAIVGSSVFADAAGIGMRATLWDASGGRHNLGTLGGNESQARAINEAGTVAGMSTVAGTGFQPHATLWQGDTRVDLGAGWAYNLNDRGQVVGVAGERAVMWNGTQPTFLDRVGSAAVDVNNHGWAVGGFSDDVTGEPARAMLWRDGLSIDLNRFLSQGHRDAGWHLDYATAINDHGWIVGTAFNSQTASGTSFVLSIPPIPEPAPVLLALAGLAALAAGARRRRKLSAPD